MEQNNIMVVVKIIRNEDLETFREISLNRDDLTNWVSFLIAFCKASFVEICDIRSIKIDSSTGTIFQPSSVSDIDDHDQLMIYTQERKIKPILDDAPRNGLGSSNFKCFCNLDLRKNTNCNSLEFKIKSAFNDDCIGIFYLDREDAVAFEQMLFACKQFLRLRSGSECNINLSYQYDCSDIPLLANENDVESTQTVHLNSNTIVNHSEPELRSSNNIFELTMETEGSLFPEKIEVNSIKQALNSIYELDVDEVIHPIYKRFFTRRFMLFQSHNDLYQIFGDEMSKSITIRNTILKFKRIDPTLLLYIYPNFALTFPPDVNEKLISYIRLSQDIEITHIRSISCTETIPEIRIFSVVRTEDSAATGVCEHKETDNDTHHPLEFVNNCDHIEVSKKQYKIFTLLSPASDVSSPHTNGFHGGGGSVALETGSFRTHRDEISGGTSATCTPGKKTNTIRLESPTQLTCSGVLCVSLLGMKELLIHPLLVTAHSAASDGTTLLSPHLPTAKRADLPSAVPINMAAGASITEIRNVITATAPPAPLLLTRHMFMSIFVPVLGTTTFPFLDIRVCSALALNPNNFTFEYYLHDRPSFPLKLEEVAYLQNGQKLTVRIKDSTPSSSASWAPLSPASSNSDLSDSITKLEQELQVYRQQGGVYVSVIVTVADGRSAVQNFTGSGGAGASSLSTTTTVHKSVLLPLELSCHGQLLWLRRSFKFPKSLVITDECGASFPDAHLFSNGDKVHVSDAVSAALLRPPEGPPHELPGRGVGQWKSGGDRTGSGGLEKEMIMNVFEDEGSDSVHSGRAGQSDMSNSMVSAMGGSTVDWASEFKAGEGCGKEDGAGVGEEVADDQVVLPCVVYVEGLVDVAGHRMGRRTEVHLYPSLSTWMDIKNQVCGVWRPSNLQHFNPIVSVGISILTHGHGAVAVREDRGAHAGEAAEEVPVSTTSEFMDQANRFLERIKRNRRSPSDGNYGDGEVMEVLIRIRDGFPVTVTTAVTESLLAVTRTWDMSELLTSIAQTLELPVERKYALCRVCTSRPA